MLVMLAMHVMLAAVDAAKYRDAGNASDVSQAVDSANSHDAGNASNANAGMMCIAGEAFDAGKPIWQC